MAPLNPPVRASEQPADADRLDIAGGVARLMGDRVVFARVLRRFRDDYANGAAALVGAVERGERALAHRLAHTLAGAAGMIGARALHRHAQALELALSRSGDVAAQLDAVSAALAELMPAIDALADGQAAASARVALAAPPGQAPVAALRRLLEDGDGAAIDLLATVRGPLAAALGEARLAAVESAALDFDFEAALAALGGSGDGEAAGNAELLSG